MEQFTTIPILVDLVYETLEECCFIHPENYYFPTYFAFSTFLKNAVKT